MAEKTGAPPSYQSQQPQQGQQQGQPPPQQWPQPPVIGGVSAPPPYGAAETLPSTYIPPPQQPVQPPPNTVFNVGLEIWKCNSQGQVHRKGNFIVRKGMIQIPFYETFYQFLQRISNHASAPPGCRLEGQPLAFMALENAPEVTQQHWNQPIGPMLNAMNPRLIVKYNAGSGQLGFGGGGFMFF
eukprot:m.98200 g.98200  ORF g.98200 m.98200 type:complete len:184 (+) comp27042_c1_seq1:239-790(+)